MTQHSPPLQRWSRLLSASFLAFFLAFTSVSHAAIPASERAVLLTLYASTNGPGWTDDANWNGAAGTECTWFGVLCNAGDANVISIELDNNSLVGPFPANLGSLTALQFISLSANQLTGSIPALSGLTALRHFVVNDNQLIGAIPALTGLANLEAFDVSNNQLTGSIPALTGLTALREFTVNSNLLTGAMPTITGLSALELVRVQLNQLTGSIPSLAGLTALIQIDASNNQFTGSIPALTGLTALTAIYLHSNQLTGSIPPLAGLTALRIFRANGNQLTGSVPSLMGLALDAAGSDVCPNQLTVSANTDWDNATAGALWSDGCTAALPNQTLSFGPAPQLTSGGSGTVTASAAPLPNSANPIVFASLTPLICTVNSASGLVSVQPAAIIGNVCTITADKAGDATANSAPQAQQNIVIQTGRVSTNVAVPTLGQWAMLLLALCVAGLGGGSIRASRVDAVKAKS